MPLPIALFHALLAKAMPFPDKDVVIAIFVAANANDLFSLGEAPAFGAPAFCPHICGVVLNGADPQVMWVHTTSVVTGVAHECTVLDWPLENFVRQSMSGQDFTPKRQLTVAVAA